MEVGFKTDKGRRRSNNEDACYVIPKKNIFIIADGVGGSNSGEIASRTAVMEVADFVDKNELTDTATEADIRNYLIKGINSANKAILESSERFEQNKGMATTMVVTYVSKGKAYICNIGDSRAYLYRGDKLIQITEDHTYVNSLLKAGVITGKEAKKHEKKNMITRAVGAEEKIDVDFFVTPVSSEDIIIMCTDGLYGEVDERDMRRMISRRKTMGDLCCDFIEMANDNGGGDNITVICLKISEDDLDE
ncbi:MAG: Stp1/IreP family PP2C-type Ser/Thr phosphatase [Hornefia sp.]|nr:Stp1/IreP family PP2C-type Ser/Thr phosphatase [Hornefia sp.]